MSEADIEVKAVWSKECKMLKSYVEVTKEHKLLKIEWIFKTKEHELLKTKWRSKEYKMLKI